MRVQSYESEGTASQGSRHHLAMAEVAAKTVLGDSDNAESRFMMMPRVSIARTVVFYPRGRA
jgi:hypothetical protein